MITPWLFASLHLVALALGFTGIFGRARALRQALDEDGFKRLFLADNLWGVAGLLWIGSGVYRLLYLEQGMAYYGHSGFFHAKMGMFALILLLELWPMATLIGWRIARGKGQAVETPRARLFAIFSDVQSLLVLLMILASAGMARGLGAS